MGPYQRPWIGDQFVVVVAPLPIGPSAALYFGASNTQAGPLPLPAALGRIGMPGCALHVSPDLLAPLANLGGYSVLPPVTIPNQAFLIGARFYNQAIVLDPPANARGAVMSDAAEGIVGAR